MDRRARNRLHARTWVALVAVAAALAVFNLRGFGEAIECKDPRHAGSSNLLGCYNPTHLSFTSHPAFPSESVKSACRDWRFGWPLPYHLRERYWLPLIHGSSSVTFISYHAAPRWLWEAPFREDPPNEFCAAAVPCNLLTCVVILVATGWTVESRRAVLSRLQFSVSSVLVLTAVVAAMLSGFLSDPTFLDVPFGLVVWLLWGFLWFGVGCTVCAGVLLALRLAKRLRFRGAGLRGQHS